jgi:cholecystokinin A receptor
LAVADLLLLLLCVPLEVLQYFLQFEDNEFICKMAKYVLLLSAAASVLNLCAVSLER